METKLLTALIMGILLTVMLVVMDMETAGICGDSDNNTEVFNCYNIGNFDGRGYNIGISEYGNIKNCYNLGKGSSIGAAITVKGTKTNCYELTGEETDAEKTTLLNSLNGNREDTTTWSEWKIDSNLNNGYPAFKWQVEEETQYK